MTRLSGICIGVGIGVCVKIPKICDKVCGKVSFASLCTRGVFALALGLGLDLCYDTHYAMAKCHGEYSFLLEEAYDFSLALLTLIIPLNESI